jgi:hypothetical protein
MMMTVRHGFFVISIVLLLLIATGKAMSAFRMDCLPEETTIPGHWEEEWGRAANAW